MPDRFDNMGNAVVLREFFGLQPGKALADFAKELKALSDEDKTELANLARIELRKVAQAAGEA